MNKVSIVVPIYNIKDYLNRCLDSIQKQTYKQFVVYCVDDGSTDGSNKIIKKYLKDRRFRLLKKKNGGLSDARNYGLKQVKTEYVLFVDGDDYLEPNLLDRSIKQIEKSKSDVLVFSYYQHNKDNRKEMIKLKKPNGKYILKNNKEILALTPNAAWNKLYKTKLFFDNSITYPKGKRYEDLGTTAKLLLKANSVDYLNTPLYNYIIDRPDNITSKVDAKIYDTLTVCNNIIDYYKKNGEFEEYKDELNYLCSVNIIQALRKVVTSKDKEFVNSFINDAFKFKNDNSFKKVYKYSEYLEKNDNIYLSKTLCKMYYALKRIV